MKASCPILGIIKRCWFRRNFKSLDETFSLHRQHPEKIISWQTLHKSHNVLILGVLLQVISKAISLSSNSGILTQAVNALPTQPTKQDAPPSKSDILKHILLNPQQYCENEPEKVPRTAKKVTPAKKKTVAVNFKRKPSRDSKN